MLEPASIILDFVHQIGLTVRFAALPPETFVPGITIEAGGLVVDLDRLLYPGDLLHEAGHLAVMLPSHRLSTADVGSDMGDEIAAQCWSYAAAVHLQLPPEIIFHGAGYRQNSESLIEIYSKGVAGVPLLQWMGLTLDSAHAAAAGRQPYPHMLRWLRTESLDYSETAPAPDPVPHCPAP